MMAPFTLAIALLLIFAAYFIKGFTGFGPALILIPTLSQIFAPQEAIVLTTVFDLMAGTVLLVSVRKQIKSGIIIRVLPIFLAGAYFGARLMTVLPTPLFKKFLSLSLLFFIGLIIWQSSENGRDIRSFTQSHFLQFLFPFFAGLGGGLVGISGPLLVVWFKLHYPKSAFRAQLIAIFAFGALWRLVLYHALNLNIRLSGAHWTLFVFVVLLAIAAGSVIQLRVNEKKFDRIVALLLIIPCITLMLG